VQSNATTVIAPQASSAHVPPSVARPLTHLGKDERGSHEIFSGRLQQLFCFF
jgi:hypothetical protein